MARNPAMTGYDNNTPYDCTIAGKKQGSQEQLGRGATPLRFATNKKRKEDFEINQLPPFCNIAVLCYFYVKRTVLQCTILVLLDINVTNLISLFLKIYFYQMK